MQERVRKGELSAGHARAILQLKSEKKQQEAAQKIVALGLSVRQAELLCKNMSKEPVPQKKEVFAVDYVAECEKSLSKHLGRGVKIVNGKRKGHFELEFYGQEDLQNLLDTLMKSRKIPTPSRLVCGQRKWTATPPLTAFWSWTQRSVL